VSVRIIFENYGSVKVGFRQKFVKSDLIHYTQQRKKDRKKKKERIINKSVCCLVTCGADYERSMDV